jgi:preprotein translocase subunit YajC
VFTSSAVVGALLFALPIPPGVAQFLPFVLIIVVFYFMLIRPNQQKQKKWQEMLSNLIQLRVPPDNIKIEVVKSAIAAVTTPEEPQ